MFKCSNFLYYLKNIYSIIPHYKKQIRFKIMALYFNSHIIHRKLIYYLITIAFYFVIIEFKLYSFISNNN